ncbi:zinc finger and SCAN domain-containing protein 10 [Caerostris darwini]|uniref:Zinc finger and SCAN domain-containing protein 10 n=1 Tax=Caerostris darwini TaxID=1538125 RepID=A0AAV4Q449_9ARAC|nr:zinc finger and SCAN domain-containing protein 10 [Caerostris darwini]
MTEDVDGGCSVLNNNPDLTESIIEPSDVSTSISQLEGALYLNSNMTIEGSCLYTATDLAGSFPEGTVLQILPDSTILAVPPVKEAHNNILNNSTLIFKDSSFPIELGDVSNSTQVSNLLVETNECNASSNPEVPIYSEGNISDIDLSFLNETEESVTVSLSKISDSPTEELQETIPIASAPLDISQNDQSSNKRVEPEIPKEGNTNDGIVMIDVSKPIQLSQNSLIMVNGQKCVLQQDPQTGQVIAYPIKEQERPRRKRGRPRKLSADMNTKDNSVSSEPSPEPEALSDEGKGLLEIVTDDGSLVRRSSRKRKKAQVLKDYETGNLKQELGSDIDEPEVIDANQEHHFRKKKPKGPGRPRKYTLTLTDTQANTTSPQVNALKRQRGRPKKQVPENEPTQAFLVQTADGQTLMMQVPLSSIPPGVSLQEVAQNIANKLNVGLSQSTPLVNIGNMPQSVQKNVTNSTLKNANELAVQDHSVGSTTSFTSVDPLQDTERIENEIENSCQNISVNVDDVIIDPMADSEVREIILRNDDNSTIASSQPERFLAENILQNASQFQNLEISQSPEVNFTLSIPTSNVSNSITTIPNLPESLHVPIPQSKSDEHDLEISFNQFQIPKDFLINSDFIRNKINLNQLLDNVANTTSASHLASTSTERTDNTVNKNISSEDPQVQFSLNESSNLKDFDANFNMQSVKKGKMEEGKQYLSHEISDVNSSEKLDKSFDFLNCDITNSTVDSIIEKDSQPNTDLIISSIVHDHNLLVHSQPICVKNKTVESSFVKPVGKKTLQPILPVKAITSEATVISIPAATVVPVSSTEQLQLSDKMLPIILTPPELPGSQKCKICQKPYFTEEEIIKHFKAEHPKCICNKCNYMAEHSYVVKRHSLRHTENGIVCEICGKHYKDHYILKMHVKMVHLPAEVVFACEICDKKFTRKAHLKRHLRIHAPNRPFKCSFCSYRGCEKSDITKHLLIHEAPKHKCQICAKAFRHLKNKELHVKRHFKQRDYKCGICDFYGYTFTDIRKHIERRHSDAKTGTCLDCGVIFKIKEELEKHRSSGQCQPASSLETHLVVKQESSARLEKKNETPIIEIPLDILGDPGSVEDSNSVDNPDEKLPFQANQLILSSDRIPNVQSGQIVVNGLEDTDIFSSENLTLLPVGNESSKLITFVSSDGKNFSVPLKDIATSTSNIECILTTDKNASAETLFLSEFETENST